MSSIPISFCLSMPACMTIDSVMQSYSKLKEALRVCAAFRGTYLDYRDKAEVINDKNKQEHDDKMLVTFHDFFPILFVINYSVFTKKHCFR